MSDISTATALLRAVVCHYDDDLPRKHYADYLRENATTQTCWRCNGEKYFLGSAGDKGNPECPVCGGEGTTRPDEDRADFIEVQLERHRLVSDPDSILFKHRTAHHIAGIASCSRCDVHLYPLRERQQRLIVRLANQLCPNGLTVASTSDYFGHLPQHQLGIYRRGFLDEIRITKQKLFGIRCQNCIRSDGNNPCPDCGGRGMEFGYGGRIEACPDCGQEEHSSTCSECNGKRYNGGRLGELFEEYPTIRKVVVTDAEPIARTFPTTSPNGAGRVLHYAWINAQIEHVLASTLEITQALVPESVFAELQHSENVYLDNSHYAGFATIEAANKGLSDAILRVATRNLGWLWIWQTYNPRKT